MSFHFYLHFLNGYISNKVIKYCTDVISHKIIKQQILNLSFLCPEICNFIFNMHYFIARTSVYVGKILTTPQLHSQLFKKWSKFPVHSQLFADTRHCLFLFGRFKNFNTVNSNRRPIQAAFDINSSS